MSMYEVEIKVGMHLIQECAFAEHEQSAARKVLNSCESLDNDDLNICEARARKYDADQWIYFRPVRYGDGLQAVYLSPQDVKQFADVEIEEDDE